MGKTKEQFVEIKRYYGFSEEANADPEYRDYLDMSSKTIGPYWESQYSIGRISGTGLSRTEKRALAEEILAIDSEEKGFNKEMENFFQNFSTKMPPEGVKLNVSIPRPAEEVCAANKEDGIVENMPVNPMEYLKYRHAQGHPKVANSFEDAEKRGGHLVEFYIVDTEKEASLKLDLNKAEDEARAVYNLVIENKKKIIMTLVLLGHNAAVMPEAERILKLKQLTSISANDGASMNFKNLKRFVEVATDKRMIQKYFIKELIRVGVLDLHGTRILEAASGTQIGATIEDAVFYLLDKKNIQTISSWKAQLLELDRATAIDDIKEPIVAAEVTAPDGELDRFTDDDDNGDIEEPKTKE